MKNQIVKALIPILIIFIILYLAVQLVLGNTSFDIHLHDTYIEIGPWQILCLCFPPAMLIYSLVAAILDKCRKRWINVLLLISACLTILVINMFSDLVLILTSHGYH
jgi:phosphoglycerol transferase MdoB-like AlkP superfamily enzyme